jgi:hypothetical protein
MERCIATEKMVIRNVSPITNHRSAAHQHNAD